MVHVVNNSDLIISHKKSKMDPEFVTYNRSRSMGGQDDWVWVDEGSMKGLNIMVDKASGEVVSLSSRYARDSDRWRENMPSLVEYANSLLVLDLDNCRYLVELSDSIGELSRLQRIFLTRCERLQRLPDSICSLSNLQEVST
jgi:hypothetical protein